MGIKEKRADHESRKYPSLPGGGVIDQYWYRWAAEGLKLKNTFPVQDNMLNFIILFRAKGKMHAVLF